MANLSHRSTPRSRPVPAKDLTWSRLVASFGYAFHGLRITWQNELNFRLEVAAGTLALLLALLLSVSPVPVLLCTGLVLGLELVNSAVEATVDLLSPQPHPLAKRAKDACAGAVLVASLAAALVGLWLFVPALWALVTGGQ